MSNQLKRAIFIVLLIIIIAFFVGCSSGPVIMRDNEGNLVDAAPTHHKTIQYAEVTPKNLPLSRYGNRATYAVDGKNYDVLLTAKGYKEQGIASWYGTKFHKKRTSSGDKYDMYQLTAAHKTLPLPTFVKVKNLENGKTAILKVNDRGPFHNDRVLDLSYAAARQLGIFANGTAKVEVEAITNSNVPAHYFLQAGAFSSMQRAKTLQKQLQEYSAKPVFITKEQRNFLVRVGPFINRENTNAYEDLLKSKGINNTFAMIM